MDSIRGNVHTMMPFVLIDTVNENVHRMKESFEINPDRLNM